ncbi:MAG: hypothetical protein ACJ75K_11285, partial [Actinomycetes bacterium]
MPGPDGSPTARDDVLPAGARHCFACGDANPIGMHLNDIRREGDQVLATLHPRPEFQSYPGVLHGGLSATALDESCPVDATFQPDDLAGRLRPGVMRGRDDRT